MDGNLFEWLLSLLRYEIYVWDVMSVERYDGEGISD